MNEFIEKLIARLEESKKVLEKAATKEMGTNGHTLDFENYNGGIGAVKCIITLVKQLTKEYNNDFCEWKIGEYGDLWKPGCGNTYELRGIRRFKFCPYCGKNIKILD